ncbi:MAG: DsbA family protein [Bacteroidota bacterium]
MKYKLIYVYDALCGWCYGFSPNIQAFVAAHAEELEVEVLSGGMITGDRIGPIGEVAGYIKWAYKEVEQKMGVTFGQAFLENVLEEGSAVFTSVPAAIAMCVFKSKFPEHQLEYATRIQKGIYYEGIAPKDHNAYTKMAAESGWQGGDFLELMEKTDYKTQAMKEFDWAKEAGISGFPTLILQKEETLYAIARGAVSLDYLEQSYERIKQL